ncbi:recombinase family protein [Paenibacillus polymyxa]|uniref:recombinase family protein n=1 Tax=Paenibacillus polymyxa TaxID=1406 RepID=UPI0025B70416|nr:recombinase family protein [Paenibacillus polymyxa]MDN4080089.1 recombinase family protein [Paenibacillus polymyxa]MDN4105089.1 recombinase family protein [Paenibacillus polymyxa]MDN4115410.1 recombinase family protein [Paenibacillus polymyxa]
MKVALYVRVSSDRQAEKELSIPAQVKAIQQYCLEKGWIIVNEFIEKGKSAKTDDRPEFQKMIALAKRSNRPFDAVVVHKFDRFSRKRDDHVIYKALLNQCGVKVISVTEQTEAETPQDMLLEGMLEVISEFFNANLATEVRKGMTQNAKQGYNNGGTPPYGYRTEHMAMGSQKTKAVWVLGPREEIETIRWMFHQYAYENVGYKKIASMLNEREVPTQKGGKWSATTVRSMIHNESYIGRKIWNKQDYQTRGKKWRDRSEWIITENAHPAIINEELFNRCQQKANERHNGGGVTHLEAQVKKSSPFWLRGVFYCDKCGSRMVGNVSATTKKYGGQKYYVCGGYMRKGKEFCAYLSWRKERIEQIVTNKLRSVLLRLTFDNQLEEEIRKYHSDANKHVLLESSNLESEITYLTRRISQLEDELKAGAGKSYYADMLQDLQNDLTAKQDELNNVKMSYREWELPDTLLQSITNDIRVMIGMLDDEMQNPQLMNEYIRKFVSNITVHRETKRVHMTVKLGDEEQVLYQKMVVVDWQ